MIFWSEWSELFTFEELKNSFENEFIPKTVDEFINTFKKQAAESLKRLQDKKRITERYKTFETVID